MADAQTDPIADVLEKTGLPKPVKADVYDAVHKASNADELTEALKHLPLTNPVRADLFDLRAKSFQPLTPPSDAPDATTTFLSHIGAQLNPVTQAKSLVESALSPRESILKPQGELFEKAANAYHQGNYGEAARHFVNYLLPLVGPSVDASENKMQEGKYAEGMGDAVGFGLALFGEPKVVSLAPELVKAHVGENVKTAVGKVVSPDTAARITKYGATATGAKLGGVPGALIGQQIGEDLGARVKTAMTPTPPRTVSIEPAIAEHNAAMSKFAELKQAGYSDTDAINLILARTQTPASPLPSHP